MTTEPKPEGFLSEDDRKSFRFRWECFKLAVTEWLAKHLNNVAMTEPKTTRITIDLMPAAVEECDRLMEHIQTKAEFFRHAVRARSPFLWSVTGILV